MASLRHTYEFRARKEVATNTHSPASQPPHAQNTTPPQPRQPRRPLNGENLFFRTVSEESGHKDALHLHLHLNLNSSTSSSYDDYHTKEEEISFYTHIHASNVIMDVVDDRTTEVAVVDDAEMADAAEAQRKIDAASAGSMTPGPHIG